MATSTMKTAALLLLIVCSTCYAFSPKGSAAVPLDKKKIAVIGAGGYTGANAFGFLQRSGSLYGTGIDRNVRGIGATKETASAVNSILSKHFILAFADESAIKLTNMESVESIQKSLEGYDAVILGNSLVVESRPVTSNTWEKGPNDKTLEVFWDTVRGKEMTPESEPQVQQIIDNTLEACQKAGIQTIVAVATPGSNFDSFSETVQSCGIQHTLIQCQNALTKFPDYNYKKGIQGNLDLSASSGAGQAICREDLAALSVACLQSCDWRQSRTLQVGSNGPLVVNEPPSKRPDQEWCVNSDSLSAKLSAY